jgi:hypothetical protein
LLLIPSNERHTGRAIEDAMVEDRVVAAAAVNGEEKNTAMREGKGKKGPRLMRFAADFGHRGQRW